MARGRFINKSFYDNYRLNSTAIEVQTDDLKVAAMIKHYEDEAGRMLTPVDLDRLKDFADNYPDGWFEKALAEYPGKPLTYIARVMESWKTEGDNPLGKSRAKAHKGSRRELKDRKDYKTPDQHRQTG